MNNSVESTKQMIAVMQAYCEGKKIEINFAGKWYGVDLPLWNWDELDYRVKPEPREWVVRVLESGHIDSAFAMYGNKTIRVREVLE